MNIHALIEARGCGPRVFHREIGNIPGCKQPNTDALKPPPHDPRWLAEEEVFHQQRVGRILMERRNTLLQGRWNGDLVDEGD